MIKNFFLGLMLCLTVITSPTVAAEQVHIGMFAYRPAAVLQDRWMHLKHYLDQEIPETEFVLHILDLDELEKGIQQNKFDFVFTNPRHYVQLRVQYPLSGALVTLVRDSHGHSVSSLGGVIVTHKDNNHINQLTDLENVRIVSPGNGFLGGYQTQLYELQQAGISIQDLNIIFAGSPHDKVFEYLDANKADVGFVRTSAIEQMVAEGKLDFERFKIINQQALPNYPFVVSTRLYPEWPFVALPKASESIAKKVAAELLLLDRTHEVSHQIGIDGFTIAADYFAVEKTMRELALPPFDKVPEVGLEELIKQNIYAVIIALSLLMIIVMLLIVNLRKNQKLEHEVFYRKQAESELSTILHTEPECVKIVDSKGKLTLMNPAGLRMIGADSLEQVIGQPVIDLIHPEYRDIFNEKQAEALAGNSIQLDFKLIGLNEQTKQRWMHTNSVPYQDPVTKEISILSVTIDITERKAMEDKLRFSHRVFTNTHEGITITDRKGTIIDVNPAFCDITGYSRDEVIGQNTSILSSGKQDAAFYEEMWASLEETGHWQGEIWNRTKEGEFFAELLSISSLTDSAGAVQNYVGIFSDITTNKQQQEQLQLMAHYDTLTGLPNRTLFADRFKRAMAHSRRYEKYLGVCFIDLDDFKPVNDNFGHEVGDELLISVSERITSCIREDDTLSRLGGDEFALLLNDLDSLEQCESTLQRILSKLKQPHYLQDEKIDVSASIGVSLYPIDNSDIDTLLRHADQAMYQAKMQGKHRYQVFDIDYDQKLSKKTVRINEIRSALKNGELELYYQPKINLLDGSVFGAEALLRWNHPTEGIVPPLRFLPLIENTDLELEVGEWVIQQAIIQLETWQQQNIDLQLSINIASYHLQSPQFVERLVHFFSVHPTVNAEQLQIEILESSVLSDIQHISATINACQKELGIKVALDDFGTGYSSLTHIRSLSANTIKIDQSFVRDLLDDPNDFVIIDSVIKMASSFNCSVIAEGVETIEDGLLLLSMGCFEAQGYVISKPLNQQAFSDWLVDYEPNEKWQQFIHTSHTKAESTRLLFQLSAERWKERFVNSLMLDRFEKHNWPILNSKKCHCGRWLKDNRGSKIFNVESVEALDNTHEQLHQAANELYQQYLNDNVEAARDNLPKVQTLYDDLQQIIQHKL